ncbi:methyl-accepting chemotaxis protein, partial [Actinoplanes sp. Pm04-4]|nr:methyl-accepting chemotaxis protein [Actinoplanes pyxinae]
MRRARKTFSAMLIGGLILTVGLTVSMGAAGVVMLTSVTNSKDAVIASATHRLSASEQLNVLAERRIGDYRFYILNPTTEHLAAIADSRAQFLGTVNQLRTLINDARQAALLNEVSAAEEAYDAALTPSIKRRVQIGSLITLSQLNADKIAPARLKLQNAIAGFIAQVQADVQRQGEASTRSGTRAIILICTLGALSAVSAVVVTVRLRRRLRRDVGAAVGHI